MSPASPPWQRLAYDELLAGQLALALVRQSLKSQPGRSVTGDGPARRIADALPFRSPTRSGIPARARSRGSAGGSDCDRCYADSAEPSVIRAARALERFPLSHGDRQPRPWNWSPTVLLPRRPAAGGSLSGDVVGTPSHSRSNRRARCRRRSATPPAAGTDRAGAAPIVVDDFERSALVWPQDGPRYSAYSRRLSIPPRSDALSSRRRTRRRRWRLWATGGGALKVGVRSYRCANGRLASARPGRCPAAAADHLDRVGSKCAFRPA